MQHAGRHQGKRATREEAAQGWRRRSVTEDSFDGTAAEPRDHHCCW